MRLFSRSIALAVTLTIGVTTASAQGPGPDTVRTRDGAMYRGTIVESVPGSHVVLMTATGESRRFEASQIETAGPSPTVFAEPPPVVPVEAAFEGDSATDGRVRLHVDAAEPGYTLMLRTGMAAVATRSGVGIAVGFDRMCTAPCALSLEPGNYNFAVEDPRGRLRAVREPVLVDGDGSLTLSVESRRRQRIVRWTLGISLFAIGVPLLARSFHCSDEDDIACLDVAKMSIGTASMAAGAVLLTLAPFTWDRGRVQFARAP